MLKYKHSKNATQNVMSMFFNAECSLFSLQFSNMEYLSKFLQVQKHFYHISYISTELKSGADPHTKYLLAYQHIQ